MSVEQSEHSIRSYYSLESHLSILLFSLQARLSADQQQWLLGAIARVTQQQDLECHATRIIGLTAPMKRVFGERKTNFELPLYDEKWRVIEQSQFAVNWSLTDIGRLVVLAAALLNTSSKPTELLQKVYSYSDKSEQRSILPGLYWLDNTSETKLFAVNAQRTNDADLFYSLALHNPFPAQHFSAEAFNQMVLKLLFQNQCIDRIHNLQKRRNPELARMCDDYLHERRFAQREIPASIWLTLSIQNVSKETLIEWENALDSALDEQRFYTAKALQECQNRGETIPRSMLEKLIQRASLEQHSSIIAIVDNLRLKM